MGGFSISAFMQSLGMRASDERMSYTDFDQISSKSKILIKTSPVQFLKVAIKKFSHCWNLKLCTCIFEFEKG